MLLIVCRSQSLSIARSALITAESIYHQPASSLSACLSASLRKTPAKSDKYRDNIRVDEDEVLTYYSLVFIETERCQYLIKLSLEH